MLNTKIINTKQASKLAMEKIRGTSVAELLKQIEERKNSTLAVAVRELSKFSHGKYYTSSESSFFYAIEMTKSSAMNSDQYLLEELPNVPEREYLAAY